jgi:hypothetical protein
LAVFLVVCAPFAKGARDNSGAILAEVQAAQALIARRLLERTKMRSKTPQLGALAEPFRTRNSELFCSSAPVRSFGARRKSFVSWFARSCWRFQKWSIISD